MVASKIKPEIKDIKGNIQDLKLDVIDLLKQIGTLMKRAKNDFIADSSGQKYGEFEREIEESVRNVETLELRMAIVAPMKAGKSTIINAIAGQDLLPSRNSAMTTLPTKIVFNPELTEPILVLKEEIISVFLDTYNSLHLHINSLGTEWMEEQLAQYPHLMELAKEIKNTNIFVIPDRVSGCQEIGKVLTSLNDVVRLCSSLDPLNEPLSRLREVPYIETPFWRSQGSDRSEQLGNLVIVDTPGPNEAGDNLKLTAVVEQELQRSSIVLIVLDFTQLNNKAAEEIKKQVQPVIELIGEENLYVLVNKVDQRRKGDMTTEQVKEFVFADLGLSESSDMDKVFEISAIQGFSATKFLLELKQNPGVDISEMATAEALAQEVFGIDWEEELEDATLEILHKKAQRLWKKSGFKPFLEKAIAALMESAAPRCMESALMRCRNLLLALKDDLNLRNRAISQDAEKLQTEVEALEADLKHLELCRNRLTEIDNIKQSLQHNLTEILEQLKEEAKVSIEDYFVEEDYDRGNIVEKIDMKAREILLTKISDVELFPKWISQRFKSTVKYQTKGVVECHTEEQAQEYANQAVAWAKQRAESLLYSVRKNSESEIKNARTGLTYFLEKETKPILQRATSRLQEAFDVDLVLPTPTLEAEDLEVDKPSVKYNTRSVDRGYGKRMVTKRKWTHWLWLVPVAVTETYKKPDKKETYYTVYLAELVTQINEQIEKSVNAINRGITEYIDADFQQRVNEYFKRLDAYLCRYRDNLRQTQADRKLSKEKQEQLISNLSYLLPEASKQIDQTENYLEITKQLMDKTGSRKI
ncbi:MAG: dynamin family protein [Prochloraceae cyanobacterium]|nr:dynamin family protein [Prochloraceae cyanobacterium]